MPTAVEALRSDTRTACTICENERCRSWLVRLWMGRITRPTVSAVTPDMSPSDQWVVQTFITMERRCRLRGLRTSVTLFDEERQPF